MWQIRPARPEDYDAVLAIWERAGLGATTPGEWSALLTEPTSAVLVAVAPSEIIGAVVATYDGWRAYIYHLAVGPAHRREGLGRVLLREAETCLLEAGARDVFVMIDQQNTEGLALAAGAGYLPAGDLVLAKRLIARMAA